MDGDGGGAGRSGAGWSDAGAVADAAEAFADDGASLVPARVAPGRPWLWVGPVKRSVVARGGETVDVPLRVAAFVPGTFALGEYRVSWELADAGSREAAGNTSPRLRARATPRFSSPSSNLSERNDDKGNRDSNPRRVDTDIPARVPREYARSDVLRSRPY